MSIKVDSNDKSVELVYQYVDSWSDAIQLLYSVNSDQILRTFTFTLWAHAQITSKQYHDLGMWLCDNPSVVDLHISIKNSLFFKDEKQSYEAMFEVICTRKCNVTKLEMPWKYITGPSPHLSLFAHEN